MTNRPTLVARRLRRDATHVEARLWQAIRRALPGWKFRRQHPIGNAIVDLACPAAKLAIELDGGHHAAAEEADTARTARIAQHGYRLIRFWNNEIIANLDGVLEAIRLALEQPPPHPNPLRPRGERER
jgi:adenine-specific DNA-methyltransferase